MSILSTTLPKKTLMVVEGTAVTPDEATKIILAVDEAFTPEGPKADDWYSECFGKLFEAPKTGLTDAWAKDMGSMTGAIKHLRTSLIANPDGTCGWVEWDGRVGCNPIELDGPTAEEIDAEWKALAAAFTCLDLICTLYDGTKPLVQFVVKAGKVRSRKPVKSTPKPGKKLAKGNPVGIIVPELKRRLDKAFDGKPPTCAAKKKTTRRRRKS